MTNTLHTRGRSMARGTARYVTKVAATMLLLAATQAACDPGKDTLTLGTEVETDFYSLETNEKQGSGTVTVTDVRKGSPDDLVEGGFQLDEDELAKTPHYIDIKFTNDGPGKVDLREPSAEDTDGNFITSLTVLDFGAPTFETCPSLPDELGPGKTAEGCAIVLVPEGVELGTVTFLAGSAEDFIYWAIED